MFRKLHRTNALLLGVFIIAHLINHIAILDGVQMHLSVMETLRFFYRPLLVEVTLFFLFGSQIILGIAMMLKKGRPRRPWVWAQFVSGIVLGVFLVQHLGAALVTRVLNSGIDTNVYWAASVVSRKPFVWYFAPYYALGILGLFVHIAAAFKRQPLLKRYANWMVAIGVLLTAAIIPGMMGWYGQAIDLPPEYVDYIDNYFERF